MAVPNGAKDGVVNGSGSRSMLVDTGRRGKSSMVFGLLRELWPTRKANWSVACAVYGVTSRVLGDLTNKRNPLIVAMWVATLPSSTTLK